MQPSRLSFQTIRKYRKPYVFATGNGDFSGSFLVRVDSDVGSGGVPHPNGGFVIGFSRVCTHMGCHLLNDEGAGAINAELPSDGSGERLVLGPCPCHGTSFDLLKSGLVVLGPATQNLAQLALRTANNDADVEAYGWLDAPEPTLESWPG